MASSFDLFRNPFVLLRVDLSATATDISEAFEDAVADAIAPEPELVVARQAMLAPMLRLDAEIAALPDTPSPEWRSILVALKSSQRLPDLRQAFEKVASLSRSNLLTHAASRAQPDAPTFTAWVKAQSAVDPDRIHREIERFREIAGVVRPDRAALASALGSLREKQARALFDGFKSPSDAIQAITACTEETISNAVNAQIDALSTLLSAYGRFVEQELSFRKERVITAARDLGSDPDAPGNLEILADALKFWGQANQPLQLLESHKGRDEPAAQGLFQEIRTVAINLANDRSRFDVALSITKKCQDIFAKLPRATQALSEDRKTLEEQVASSKVNPLATAINQLGDNLGGLAGDLSRSGFGAGSVGTAKAVRDAFIVSVRASSGGTVADLPWLMMRAITVRLNNELEKPESALALMKGLQDLARDLGASAEINERLSTDRRAIERNKLETELVAHLKGSRFGAALSAIENLLRDYKSPEEKHTLENLKAQVERKKIGQYLRWGFWPAIALVGLVLANIDTSHKATYRAPETTYRPPPYQPPTAPSIPSTPPQPTRSYAEDMPTVGAGMQFTQANIRYCVFQEARLEYIKPRSSGSSEISEFNRLVDDYNSRCSRYRYRQSDKASVDAEMYQKRSDLNTQAERLLQSWRPRQSSAPSFSPASPATAPPLATPTPAATLPAPPTISSSPPSNHPSQASYDLLKIDDASHVQERLVELGFLKGSADGTWGPQSRSALRVFRVTIGLVASDAWDDNVAHRLFSPDAPKASNPQMRVTALPDAVFAPPTGATMNPLNKADAGRIHARLRDLGLFQAKNSAIWSTASRTALREFKLKNDLPADDLWDATTEQKLFDANAIRSGNSEAERFTALFTGTWAANARACPILGVASDTLPLTITRDRAEAGNASCNFQEIKPEGQRWAIKAQCRGDNTSWAANITLVRSGNQLTWSSERGVAIYYRCGS